MDKKSQIVLVLDGPEKFTDEFGNEQSGDWIPKSFPDRFKVIIVVYRKSKCMQHFINRKYPILMLRGLYQEDNFIDLCSDHDLTPENSPSFFSRVREFVNFQEEEHNI